MIWLAEEAILVAVWPGVNVFIQVVRCMQNDSIITKNVFLKKVLFEWINIKNYLNRKIIRKSNVANFLRRFIILY